MFAVHITPPKRRPFARNSGCGLRTDAAPVRAFSVRRCALRYLVPTLTFCTPLGVAADAQQTTIADAGFTAPSQGPVMLTGSAPTFSRFDNMTGLQDDVLVGQNGTASYKLSWKNARADSEVVVRNGIVLRPGVDYTLDWTQGTITFMPAPTGSDLIRVTYLCNTDNAVRNLAAAPPVLWDLWSSGQNHLRFATLQQTGAADGVQLPGGALQFTGAEKFLPTSTMKLGMFLDLRDGDWLQRGGLSLSEQTQSGRNGFALSLSRAGSRFTQQDVASLSPGQQALALNGTLSPLRTLTLALGASQTTQLLDPSQASAGSGYSYGDLLGNTTRELTTSAALALPQGGKIDAGHTQTQVSSPQGELTNTDHDDIHVTRPVARGVDVTLGYDTSTTTTSSSTESATQPGMTQTASLGLAGGPGATVSLSGSFQQSTTPTAVTDDRHLTLEATPLGIKQAVKLKTDLDDQTEADGAHHSGDALLQLPAISKYRLQLSGGVRLNSAPGTESTVGLVDASLNPARNVQLSGALRVRDGYLADNAPDPNAVNTYDLKLAISPLKSLKLTGRFAYNPEDSSGSMQRLLQRELGMEADMGAFALRGQVGLQQDTTTGSDSDTADFGIDLHLTRYDTLTTGLQAHNLFSDAPSGDDTYLLGFTHRLGAAFDLSLTGSIITHIFNGHTAPAQTEYKAQAKLGIHF